MKGFGELPKIEANPLSHPHAAASSATLQAVKTVERRRHQDWNLLVLVGPILPLLRWVIQLKRLLYSIQGPAD